MKANNLSISVPNKGCDKNCPYCVSKMTGKVETEGVQDALDLMSAKADKIKNFATMAQVSSVSITGKGEPMLNFDAVDTLAYLFKNFPLEIQTNGIVIASNPEYWVKKIKKAKIDIIAISVDHFEDVEKVVIPITKEAHKHHLIVRVTLNITDMLFENEPNLSYEDFFKIFQANGVDQFSIRNVTAPKNSKNQKVSNWIKDHTNGLYDMFVKEMDVFILEHGTMIRELPYGAVLYDVMGVSITSFDYCIQDKASENDIRSLIFMEDGHLYTAWNSKASRLF